MSTLRHLPLVVVVVLLSACVPTSEHALTAPGEQALDAKLIGTWYWTEPNETGYVHIGRNEQADELRVMMVEWNADGVMKLSGLHGHNSTVGDHTYLNLKWSDTKESAEDGYLFVKYTLTDDRLGIAVIRQTTVEQAVSDGALAGNIEQRKWFSTVHLSASQRHLQAFVQDNDKALFEDMHYLYRLPAPPGTGNGVPAGN